MPVKSQPPHGQSGATSQVRTPLSEDTSDGVAQGATGDEVEGREMDDDEDCRAHECVDDKTSTSASSALRDHPDVEATDSPRPSEDPVDTTGDDGRRPDKPTEPPDVLKASREVEGGAGDGDDDEHRPEKRDEPSNDLAIEPRDPKDVQVEPGGETSEAE
jgi:hypothetical protein